MSVEESIVLGLICNASNGGGGGKSHRSDWSCGLGFGGNVDFRESENTCIAGRAHMFLRPWVRGLNQGNPQSSDMGTDKTGIPNNIKSWRINRCFINKVASVAAFSLSANGGDWHGLTHTCLKNEGSTITRQDQVADIVSRSKSTAVLTAAHMESTLL